MPKILLNKKNIQEIDRLRAQFPKELRVHIERSQNGKFIAEVLNFKGCITEADTFVDLIGMVNDAVYTYFEIPQRFLSSMPSYVPPANIFRLFTAFPAKNLPQRMTLSNPNYVRQKVTN